MGLVKTRRLAAIHPPTPAASTYAEATVDESADRQAAARNPPSPRLRRIKGGDEAAEDFRSRETSPSARF